MSTGAWFVLCQRPNQVSLVDVASGVTRQRGTKVLEVRPDEMVVEVNDSLTGNVATFDVCVAAGPGILAESQEIAERVTGPERAAIEACDVRYVMTWDLEFGDETYNAMMVAAEVIAKACKGVVYDEVERIVMWSEAK